MRYWRIFLIYVIIVILSGCPLPGDLDKEDPETEPEKDSASFWYSPAFPGPGQTITFYASNPYDPNGILHYEWNFGDTCTEFGYIVQHEYASAGRYLVTLTVKDGGSDTDTCVQDILVSTNTGFLFVVYGDSRTYPETHQSIVNAFSLENPELVIHSGDLWDGYSPSEWLSHYQSNPVTDTLLKNNRVLVARGNHESEFEVIQVMPPIIKDIKIEYSFTQGNCFFICMGLDPGKNNTWLEQQLQSQDAQNAVWRIIYCHKPIYSAGTSHGADGFASSGSSISHFRALCDTYDVTWVFSGHDHHYERTHFIYDGTIVHTSTTIPSGSRGTFYIVTGGGGAPLYPVGSDWWTNIAVSEYHYCLINAFNDRCELITKKMNGSVLDLVTVYK